MSSKEINPHNEQLMHEHTSETGIESGELARVPRIVLFGSRSAGRSRAIEFIEDAIKGVPNSEVGAARFEDRIEEAFYGRFKQAEEKAIESSEPLQKPGRLKRVTDLVLRRTVETTVNSGFRVEYIKREDTIPQGVVIFPEMRRYDPRTDSNMTIPTPVEAIKNLCEKYGVPMAFANNDGDMAQIKQLAQGLSE